LKGNLLGLLILSAFIFAIHLPAKAVQKHEEQQPLKSNPKNIIRVPLTRQATDYTCGVSALQSLLAYYGDEVREDNLSRLLKSNPEEGTSYLRIAEYARQQKYHVELFKHMGMKKLRQCIDKGLPVICLIQAWADERVDYAGDWKDGHYVVAIGYDDRRVYFMDPSTTGNYTFISTPEFLKRWHDTDGKERLVNFGMTISKGKPVFNPAEFKPID